MSPCEIEFLLHCYTCPNRHENYDANALSQSAEKFLAEKLIEKDEFKAGVFNVTPKGAFLIRYLCDTPLPETNYSIERNQ